VKSIFILRTNEPPLVAKIGQNDGESWGIRVARNKPISACAKPPHPVSLLLQNINFPASAR
jgi:hypothetical protein